MRRVEIHIDRLVLDGFDAGTRVAIVPALETELVRRFGPPGALAGLGEASDVDRTRRSKCSLPGNATPAATSIAVARGVVQALDR